MRIFLTGSNGFIGSTIVSELVAAGHQVLGLTRSDAGATALIAAGAEPFRGNVEDLDSLRQGAERCDGVIHTAFDHNFAHFVDNCEKDRRAIMALGSALEGSDRLLVITSGTGMGAAVPGQPAVESAFNPAHPNPRVASEMAGLVLSERGVKVAVMRLAQIHNTVKQGLITYLIEQARQQGVSAYVGDGQVCWSAAHVTDTARLYRLAFEKQQGDIRYNACAEGAITVKEIAEAIGRSLGIPTVSLTSEEKIQAHFGWLAMFANVDMSASNTLTRERLDWQPNGPGLIADIENMRHDIQ